MLDNFKCKVEKIADGYADVILKEIEAVKTADELIEMEMFSRINSSITILNHVANTLERINRLQHEVEADGSEED